MPSLDVELDVARQTFETNFFGVIAVTNAFSPLIIAAKGAIVNNSSIAAWAPMAFEGIYSATKAALEAYSSSLRMEMSAFGVKVIILTTGAIKSNFMDNTSSIKPVKLPESSIFVPIKDIIERDSRTEEFHSTAMPTEEYAKYVVNRIIKDRPASIWYGAFANPVWWGSTFLPTYLKDQLLEDKAGIKTLKERLTARKE
jgi:1-acylglycerone phosphate reductase